MLLALVVSGVVIVFSVILRAKAWRMVTMQFSSQWLLLAISKGEANCMFTRHDVKRKMSCKLGARFNFTFLFYSCISSEKQWFDII